MTSPKSGPADHDIREKPAETTSTNKVENRPVQGRNKSPKYQCGYIHRQSVYMMYKGLSIRWHSSSSDQ